MTDKLLPEECKEEDLVADYVAARPTYEAFTNSLHLLIPTLLRAKGIDCLAVEPRTKTVDSFKSKVKRPEKGGKYLTLSDITDLSGLRIIAYHQQGVEAICEMIEENFQIDGDNSIDKNSALAPDRFGYASVHYIVTHKSDRVRLMENRAFDGMKAEIQVRTVLQHAWAALDRKLRYNNEEDIPREIRRKLFRVSALLEMADDSFSEIEATIKNLRTEYENKIKHGNFDSEINIDSLEVFIRTSEEVRILAEIASKYYVVVNLGDAKVESVTALASISKLVTAAHIAEIKTIGELKKLIGVFIGAADGIFANFSKYTSDDRFITTGLVRLAIVCASDKKTGRNVLRFVPFFGKLQNVLLRHVQGGSRARVKKTQRISKTGTALVNKDKS